MRASQKRAVPNHRRHLAERGISRYEVRGSEKDKDLVRRFARRLAIDDAVASRLRADVMRQIGEEPPRRGGIYAALRGSPLVGAELNFAREVTPGREIDL